MTITLTEGERRTLAEINWFEDTEAIAPAVESIISARLAPIEALADEERLVSTSELRYALRAGGVA